jgi:predicted ATPase/DNA-binding winged helix-turn-helix (wHTH) protein
LDIANQRLWRDEQTVGLSLKAFAVLQHLIERPGQLVTKEELLEAVWPNTFVTDAVLKVRVGELRKALGDEARTPRFIETAQRRGYRFIATLTPTAQQSSVERSAASPHFVVGRSAELSFLQNALGRALAGRRQIVFVSGEPGIGKTTLVNTFLNEADANLIVGRGQCLEQYGGSEAYLPWLDAFSRLARERQGCVALLRQQAPMWLAQMPWLLDDAQRATLHNEIAGATRARMLREMAQMIEALTADTPLILTLEDLHWSDYSTLDLIGYVARRSEPARLLLIGTYRPVEVILSGHPFKSVKQELRTHHLCAELPLDFLSEAAVADYLQLRFPGHQFPPALAQLIHARTDGNPLFMVSVVDELAPESLVDKAGESTLAAAMKTIEVATPANVRQMIEKQIERLSEPDRRTLEAASVAGVEFSSLLAAADSDLDVSEVEESCARLARHDQLIRATGQQRFPDGTVTTTYEFIHALYQNAFYERVSVARRVRLNQRIGELKEASQGERAAEIATELALHFEQGCDWERAAKYLTQAARQANEMFAAREAVVLASRGLQAVAKLPDTRERSEQELSLQIILGNALLATKGFAASEVMRTYARARDLCQQIGQTPYLLPVLYGLFANHLVRGEHRTALRLGEEFLGLAERNNDPATVVGHRMIGLPLFSLGELPAARKHLEQIVSLYDPAQHRQLTWLYGQEPGMAGYAFLALTLWLLGYPEAALKRQQEGINLAREVSHPQSQAYALTWDTMHYQFRQEFPGTRASAAAIITVATEQGLVLWSAWGTILHGWAMANEGQGETGIGQMIGGLQNMQSSGTRMFRPYYLCLLAQGYGKAGQYREGLAVLGEALALGEKTDEHFCEAELYRVKGELLLLNGTDAAVVEVCFQRAIEIASKQSAKSFELRAVLSLTRLWQRQGKVAQGRELLAHTFGWFTEGFDTPDLQAARRLLEELS